MAGAICIVGGEWQWGMHGWGHAWWGACMAAVGVCMAGGHVLWGWEGAGETQPTGMHSCLTCFFTMYRKYTKSN